MKHASICIFILFFSLQAQAKLLDKILAVIDDQVITYSEITRIKDTIRPRREIAPLIFTKADPSQPEIVSSVINMKLVRDKLSSLGYVINDDQVESQIKSTEERLGLNRNSLLRFLKNNGLEFDEYFELTRESIELNIFNARVIAPLINISDQDIKNEFYKQNSQSKTISFKYILVDFILSRGVENKFSSTQIRDSLKQFQAGSSLPQGLDIAETNVLGEITADGLSESLRVALKNTEEGDFSKPIALNGTLHSFFVKKRDLVESDVYLKQKERIHQELFQKLSDQVTHLWFQREESKHYIVKYLK